MTIIQIQEVSRKLKESTRTLCRVLKDNPDVEGNQKKIQVDREQLVKCLQLVLGEDTNRLQAFKEFLQREDEMQGELEKRRKDEKHLLGEIKQTDIDTKQAQETAAKTQEENEKDIKKCKKCLNEAQTD